MKVEAAILSSPSLIICTVSVDMKQQGTGTNAFVFCPGLQVNVAMQNKTAHTPGSDTSCLRYSYDGRVLASRGGEHFFFTLVRKMSRPGCFSSGDVVHLIVFFEDILLCLLQRHLALGNGSLLKTFSSWSSSLLQRHFALGVYACVRVSM